MTLTINIIGAGKLGKTIGRLLVCSHLAKIAGVCNRSIESAQEAIAFIGQGKCFSSIQQLPSADITLITTPDNEIREASVALSHCEHIHPGHICLHMSGVLTSDILSAIKEKQGLVASCHPMRSFAEPSLAAALYAGTFCAIEGDMEALNVVKPLFESFGSKTFPIQKEKKSLYHAAGVFASNYLVTLSQQAFNCFIEAGLEKELALKMTMQLMKGTLSNIENCTSPSEALTGPIQRGDTSSITAHLNALTDKEQKNLYAVLGKATLDLTSHENRTKAELMHCLLGSVESGSITPTVHI